MKTFSANQNQPCFGDLWLDIVSQPVGLKYCFLWENGLDTFLCYRYIFGIESITKVYRVFWVESVET